MIGAILACVISSSVLGPTVVKNLPVGSRVLFQGDSITDGNRGRNDDPNHILGHGYAFLIAAATGSAYPDRNYSFLNRGISGNSISDLAARWDQDTLALKPDVLSILVGINDVEKGTSPTLFESTYDALLCRTVEALPKVKLILCEPFGYPAGWRKPTWETRAAPLAEMQQAVDRLAKKYHAVLVKFQPLLDEAVKQPNPEYWIWDGVHPTYNGHQRLAETWVNSVNKAKTIR